jgi:hypothetical protein
MPPDRTAAQAEEQTSLLGNPANHDPPASDALSMRRRRSLLLRGAWHALKATWKSSTTNYLLPFLPLGIVAESLEWSSPAIFVFNFLAMLPLASLLSYGTEEVSKSVGPTVGGLLNATFGNLVEMIVRHTLCYPSFSIFFLTRRYLGRRHSPQTERDQHCPVQHGRQHSIRSPASKSLLLPTHLSKIRLAFKAISKSSPRSSAPVCCSAATTKTPSPSTLK